VVGPWNRLDCRFERFIEAVQALQVLWCVDDAVLGQSLPRRQGLKYVGSSRQLAVQCGSTVREELDEDTSSANDSRVYFDVGDDVS